MKQKSFLIRYIVLCSLFFFSITSFSQAQRGISTAYLYKGYWSKWVDAGKNYYGTWGESRIGLAGEYDHFCIYDQGMHPSDFFFKFRISNYIQPSKKEIKQHYKKKTEWVYSGYVEYYVSDLYPTFEDCLRELKRPLKSKDVETEDYNRKLSVLRASKMSKGLSFSPIGYKKITRPATIKIMPYKKLPQCYNFFFDDVGYAIDLGMFYVVFDPNRRR